eukprot:6478895-Amphidinium_carterae.1
MDARSAAFREASVDQLPMSAHCGPLTPNPGVNVGIEHQKKPTTNNSFEMELDDQNYALRHVESTEQLSYVIEALKSEVLQEGKNAMPQAMQRCVSKVAQRLPLKAGPSYLQAKRRHKSYELFRFT